MNERHACRFRLAQRGTHSRARRHLAENRKTLSRSRPDRAHTGFGVLASGRTGVVPLATEAARASHRVLTTDRKDMSIDVAGHNAEWNARVRDRRAEMLADVDELARPFQAR